MINSIFSRGTISRCLFSSIATVQKHEHPFETFYLGITADCKNVKSSEITCFVQQKNTLKAGTTTACYYGTIHRKSTNHLVQAAASRGQRALVGKVNMNRNSNGKYVETSADSIEETKQFIKDVKGVNVRITNP